LQNDVGKAIKEMRDKKVMGDDVLGDVLKLLGKNGLRIVTQLMNNTNDTGEWPRDFTVVTVIVLQKKPRATIWSDHCTIQPHFTYSKGV
jgi:hypothetical protein